MRRSRPAELVRAYVGLGSNLGDGRALIKEALAELESNNGIRIVRRSGFYLSAAWGVESQADFVNAVAELEVSLSGGELLAFLQATEEKGGRTRGPVRWAPRTIDLDLLLYGQQVLRQPGLEVPHPRMHLRAFVLLPLLELVPGLEIPGVGLARKCLDSLENQRVEKID